MKLEKKIRNMQIERTLIFHFDLQTLASVDNTMNDMDFRIFLQWLTDLNLKLV